MRRGKAGCLLLILAVAFIITTAILITNLGACHEQGGYTTHSGYCAGRTTP
jgi:hypothetical protein